MGHGEQGAGGNRGLAAEGHRPRVPWWSFIGLVCLVAAAYGQTFFFGFVWDDHVLFEDSRVFRGRVGWRQILTSPSSAFLGEMPGAERMYRPLLAFSVAMDRAIWGLRPAGLHLSNVLAHLAVVLVLWRITWWLTGSRMAAFVAGALLAVHPSAVEPVAFIAGRADLLVALGMGVVLLLMRGCPRPGGVWRLLGALLCFALALGSKETALVIPAIVTWAAWVYPEWLAGPASTPRRFALATRILPFWVLLGVYAVVRHAVIGDFAPVPVRWTDMPAQALRALAAIATYARLTVIPRPATGLIRVESPAGPADSRVLLGLAVGALLLAGLVWLRRAHPSPALALGWYAAALIPPSNLVPIYWRDVVNVAERSLYPALAGWCLLVAVGVHALGAAAGNAAERVRRTARLAGAGVLTVFLIVTAVKVTAWRDDVTLWTSALLWDSGHVGMHMNLAIALAKAGDLEKAQTVLREAGAHFPQDPRVASVNGWVAEVRGEPAEALREYERAIALGAHLAPAYRQAALAAVRLQEWDRAGHWFQVAASRYPQAAWPQVGLGWYYERRDSSELARAHFDRAARLEPNASERPWFLGQLLAAEGRLERADQAYRAALALDPAYAPARRELALIAEQGGRTTEAIAHWRDMAQTLPGRHGAEALAHLRRLEAAPGGGTAGGTR